MEKLWGTLTAAKGRGRRGERRQEEIGQVQRVTGEFLVDKKCRENRRRHGKAWERAGEKLTQIKENHQPLGTCVGFYFSPY